MAKRSKRKSDPIRSVSPVVQNRPAGEVVISDRLSIILRAFVIIAVGLWVYSPALHGDWLWDDDWYITNQPLLRDWDGLWKFWFQPGSWVEYYPIEETVLWVEWHLWGNDTLGYHLVTTALHLVNALLVWRLLAKFDLRKAWLGGLIFAVHPAMVDSVAWIAETKNTLALLPFLLAMCAWIDYEQTKKRRDYGLSLGFFVVAMICKITVSLFPVAILLYAWWKRGRIRRNDLVASAPFFAVSLVLGLTSLASSVWYYQSEGKLREVIPFGDFFWRLSLAGQSLGVYFLHCFWPVNLLPVYFQWKVDPASLWQFLPWLVLGGAICWLWTKRGTWGRHALLGIGFFLIFLVPFLGFTPVSYMAFTWTMDHFLYIPLIGIIGLVVAAIGSVEDRLPLSARPMTTGLVTALVALLAFEAHGYAAAYTDEATLWGYTVQHNPQNWMAQDNLGKALLLLNRPQDAATHFQASLQTRPQRSQTHLNLGGALVEMDRLPEGIAEYDRALSLNPTDAEIYNQKGVALLQAGRFSEALAQFGQAIQLRPNYVIALDNEGVALAQSGRLPEAIERFNEALKINPGDLGTLDNLGSALQQSGRVAEARERYQDVLQIDPGDAKALQNLGKLSSGPVKR